MALGMMGIKLGMTQVFIENGQVVPVTVIEIEPNAVSQVKTREKDGYNAVQLAFGDIPEPTLGHKRNRRIGLPEMGHLKKAGLKPKRWLKEFRVEEIGELTAGQNVTCEIFDGVTAVDVIGITKGRGFQGIIKRWGQHRGPMTHGSKAHRRVCSIGASSSPSRVFKGKHMPGHMGSDTQTMRNLKVVELDSQKAILLVKGAVPGSNGSRVIVLPTAKKKRHRK